MKLMASIALTIIVSGVLSVAQPRPIYPAVNIYLDDDGSAVCNGTIRFPLYVLAQDPSLEYQGFILLKEAALGLEGYYGLAIVPVAGAKPREYMEKLAESITNIHALNLIKRFYLPVGELSQIDVAYDSDTNTIRISSRYRIFSEELDGVAIERLEVLYLIYTGVEFNYTLMMDFSIYLKIKKGITEERNGEYKISLNPVLRFLPAPAVAKLSLVLPSPEYKLVTVSPKPYSLRFSRIDWLYTGAEIEPYEVVLKPPRSALTSAFMAAMTIVLVAVNAVLAMLYKKRRV